MSLDTVIALKMTMKNVFKKRKDLQMFGSYGVKMVRKPVIQKFHMLILSYLCTLSSYIINGILIYFHTLGMESYRMC